MFGLYRNSDLNDRIYECLLTTMAVMQAEGVSASFRFVGDLNGHPQTINGHESPSIDGH